VANREEGLKRRESGERAVRFQLEEAVWEKTGANTESSEEQTSLFTFAEYGWKLCFSDCAS